MAIFISYSHADSEKVDSIARYLVQRNIYIWIDKWELNFGDSLIERVQNGIMESSVLLIMLSKASVESAWCKKELSSGLVRELEEKRTVTIPVLLEECEIPIFLRDKYYADLRTDFDNSLKRLADNLLKNTDITLNRVENKIYSIDWSVDHGIKNDKFLYHIDSVSFSKEYEYSILCQIDLIGNKKLDDRYSQMVSEEKVHFLLDEIIDSLVEFDNNQDLRVVIESNLPILKEFTVNDSKNKFSYYVSMYIKQLGINNGFDIIFDFGSILRLLKDKRTSIYSKE